MKYIVLVLVTASFAQCDWVEIPQATVSLDRVTEKLDFTSYMLTTTSTTIQTPVLPKPAANKKLHTTGHVKPVSLRNKNATITYTSTMSSIVSSLNNKTDFVNKNIINSINVTTVNKIDSEKDNDTEEAINDDHDENVSFEEPDVKQNKEGEAEYGYSYVNFIPYMSSIQSVLMKSAHKSKKSKVNVLTNLRDHLLGEIEHRMTTLWNPSPANKEAREYKDDSHVDFPSNEGALLTIGFLTFGVFLIKLVLHLIQAIHNKMNNDDNGVTTTTIIGRKRRAAVDNEAIKILNYIEQFRFK